MDSTKIILSPLQSYDLSQVVAWYGQRDKSWLYCDCPLDFNYSQVEWAVGRQLNNTFDDLANPNNMKYYSIFKYEENASRKMIGFALIRKGFEYFQDVSGYSIGLDIPEKNDRGNGIGTIAIRKLLHELEPYKNKGLSEIYLETLSYNKPMQKVAEKLGFELIRQKESEERYQNGLIMHIAEISDCVNIKAEELQNEKVQAMLYKIDFDKWSDSNLG